MGLRHLQVAVWALMVAAAAAAHAQLGNPTDSDNDGTPDESDSCPTTYGSGYDGCPTEDDIEEITVVGTRTINLLGTSGTVDCTNPPYGWEALCSAFRVPRVGFWHTQSPVYSGTWNPSWRTSNDHIDCPERQVPSQGEEQRWFCACAPGYRNETGCGPRRGMTCISNAEFLDNAGAPPQCMCGQPLLSYCETTWKCPPESICNIMWYVVPAACQAAVAALPAVVCNTNMAGRVVCSIVADQIVKARKICPEIGPPISPEEVLGGDDVGDK